MTTYPAPMCLWCERRLQGGTPLVCTAFPTGVPAEIWQSKEDHRQPYQGDGGQQFLPLSEEAAALVEQRWRLLHG